MPDARASSRRGRATASATSPTPSSATPKPTATAVVRDFCGHGLGRLFHDSPEVVHAGRPGTGPELTPGMFFTVEPMINIGRADVKLLDDGWTAVTRDRSLSAQFEHSIGITETAARFLPKARQAWTSRPTRNSARARDKALNRAGPGLSGHG